ncbi:hypothetical protein AB6A40_007722 [Gnathostoma spinigerum]|uniref:Fatty-acid and retinol-binding protein 1 n=1 Tax=Gnathostoma spinigerum TaxID=75299 RepID=A0ABD6EVC9_9BILA
MRYGPSGLLIMLFLSTTITGSPRLPHSRVPHPRLASTHTDVTSLAIELLEFIPPSVFSFFADLNDTDRSALLELSKNISRSRLTPEKEQHFLEELKHRSLTAYNKVTAVQRYLQQTIDGLEEESKNFTRKISEKYVSLFTGSKANTKGTFGKLKTFTTDLFKYYDEMSNNGKANLRAAFPETAQLISSMLSANIS